MKSTQIQKSEGQILADKDRRIWSDTQFSKVFTFQMQRNCFPKIPGEFIEGFSLSDHWKIDAITHVIPFPFGDMNLDDCFHTRASFAALRNWRALSLLTVGKSRRKSSSVSPP